MLRMLKMVVDAIGIMLVIFLLFGTSALWARCVTNDTWRGWDKQAHFGAGAVVSTLVTMHTADPWKGFWVGTAVGATKEVLDAAGAGGCSLQDFLATTAGAAVGAVTGGFIVTRVQGRTQVVYVRSF